MAAATIGFFSKIWSFLSSPFGHIFTSAIESGSRKIGEKLTSQVEKMFEIGEKSLGDEVLCDNALEGMDQTIIDSFESFMGWLEEQQPDGKKRSEKIREVIVKKITSKEIKTGGGKNGKPVEVEIVYNYTLAQGFIKRMMSHSDHGSILQWLKRKNFFSTITVEKKSTAAKVAGKLGTKAKLESQDLSDLVKDATQWLKDNKKQ
ncbi:MAG: hypothetical protein WC682_03910 [Parcubacteria group bacterium]|jgi:hypothetical protein